ncbi:MAG: carbamoyl-phosphate synthase large subunit [Bacteriovoracaceae bacterium]|jgi:carbamoyl-phosphate synthase large subunit
MKLKNLKVLVSACGGDIGYSVGKILQESGACKTLLGMDLSEDHAGFHVFDKCIKAPGAKDENYISFVEELIQNELLDFFIPISEPEIEVLMNSFESLSFKKKILMPNLTSIKVGLDKFNTFNFLKENGLKPPHTVLATSEDQAFPLILKSRTGRGSKDVYLVKNKNELLRYKDLLNDDFIFQEFIPEGEGEFTCGLYRNGEVTRSIILKRRLVGGLTGSGETIENVKIKKYLEELAEKIDLHGSINIQLRLNAGRPMVFEINPRFSSTVYFRNKLGFPDLIWCIADQLNLEVAEFTPPKAGIKFYRVGEELIKA